MVFRDPSSQPRYETRVAGFHPPRCSNHSTTTGGAMKKGIGLLATLAVLALAPADAQAQRHGAGNNVNTPFGQFNMNEMMAAGGNPFAAEADARTEDDDAAATADDEEQQQYMQQMAKQQKATRNTSRSTPRPPRPPPAARPRPPPRRRPQTTATTKTRRPSRPPTAAPRPPRPTTPAAATPAPGPDGGHGQDGQVRSSSIGRGSGSASSRMTNPSRSTRPRRPRSTQSGRPATSAWSRPSASAGRGWPASSTARIATPGEREADRPRLLADLRGRPGS